MASHLRAKHLDRAPFRRGRFWTAPTLVLGGLAVSLMGAGQGCTPSATVGAGAGVGAGAAATGQGGPPPAPGAAGTAAGDPTVSPGAATPATAAATADAGELARLADAYWHRHLVEDPLEATLLGYPGLDDKMPDESESARVAYRADLVALQRRLTDRVRPEVLAASARVTRGMLAGELAREVAVLDCNLGQWAVDPRDGPQVALLDLAGLQKVDTVAAGRTLVARWRAIPTTVDEMTRNLLHGLADGKVAARSEIKRVLRQLDELLAHPDTDWPLVAAPVARAQGSDWTPAAQAGFRSDLLTAVAQGIRPSFARYRDAIRNQVLKRARGDARVGISNIPGGDRCYLALAQAHTSLEIDPKQIHAIGLAELKRIRGEIEALGPNAVGSGRFGEIRRRLSARPRPGDAPVAATADLFFATRDEIETAARATLARATLAEPRFLGRLPRTLCEVKRIEAHEEKDAPIAYYRQPAMDGSRPGTYQVNTFDPTSRPRFESEALAFHESVPGHHVQIALAQEMTGVPDFQKNSGVTAFVEGWGLYAERLADELGLYSSPLTRLGRLSLEAWRAARLVVDTGLHAMGWSRGRAVRFLTDNTLIAGNNIENEVDRYIGWPGQALAYKLGELEIVRLRAESRARLGTAFDLRAFHDVVLGNGAISLPVLRTEIARWWDTVGGPGVAPGAAPAPAGGPAPIAPPVVVGPRW